MPELPEVETVVRGLRATLPGRTIVGVRLGKSDFIDDPAALGEQLPGKRVVAVERIGKFICIELASDNRNKSSREAGLDEDDERLHFIVHLGMTGRFGVRPASEPV